MQPSPPEKFGLKRFRIKPSGSDSSECWIVTAKDRQDAWRRFVAIAYRRSPLKPCQSDFTITLEKRGE